MTTVKLLNVPFESNYKDTVFFPRTEQGKLEQERYFLNPERDVRTFSDFSYQRKDNIIRIPAHIDTLYNCNYVMYKNSSNPNKWFYAFIIDMKYVNDERTDITIQTDVMQTWWFDYNVQPSFVEREHVDNEIDDSDIGLHTVPEMLETGEYICDGIYKKNTLTYSGIIVGATIDLRGEKVNNKYKNVEGGMYAGVYGGVKYFYYTHTELPNVLKDVAENGQSDGIVSMFMCPSNFVKTTNGVVDVDSLNVVNPPDVPGTNVDPIVPDGELFRRNNYVTQHWAYWNEDENPKRPLTIDGYEPRNKKLLTFPYCYLLASNNAGASNIYRYELFEYGKNSILSDPKRDVDFLVASSITPGMSIRLIPLYYNGVDENWIEGLTLGKFPICSWNNDVYTNWLTQNSVNMGIDLVGGVAQVVSGVALAVGTGGVGAVLGGGSIVGGVTSIGKTLGQVYQHSFQPPSASGNINSGDVTFSSGNLTFTLYQMNIKREYAEIIDNYFDMFGYKVNRVKVPNEWHRLSYWYTKTIDVNIDGAIPNKDLDQIKQNYNNGITFWEYTAKMGDYSQINTVYTGDI